MEAAFHLERFMEAVQGVYRLFRVAGFHSLENEAVEDSIQRGIKALRTLEEDNGVLLLFTRDTVLVNGRLLPMPPDTYETALALRAYLDRCEINSIWLGPEVDSYGMRRLLHFFRRQSPNAEARDLEVEPDAKGYLGPGLRVRKVANQFLVGLESPDLDPLDRGLLTYALAVRVIRHLRTNARRDGASIPAYFKRVARQLTRIDFQASPEMLDVTVGHDVDDGAAVAVDSAVVALAAARRLTVSERVLTRIVLTAMTLDLGLPEHGLATDRAAEVALAHMRLAQMRGDAAPRTVTAWEAGRILDGTPTPEVYRAGIYPSLETYLVIMARYFVESFGRFSRARDPAPVDQAVEEMRAAADTDIGVIAAELITQGLLLITRGTPVRVGRESWGIVLQAARSPSRAARPIVRIIRPTGTTEDVNLDDSLALQQWGEVQPMPHPWPADALTYTQALDNGASLIRWHRMLARARAQYAERRGVAYVASAVFEGGSRATRY